MQVNLISRGIFRSIDEFRMDESDKPLGTGSFGVVRLATHRTTLRRYAVKIVDLTVEFGEYEAQLLEREVQLHMCNEHPHIIHLWDVLQTETRVYLIMDFACNGTLFYYKQRRSTLSEGQVLRIFSQIVAAVDCLHLRDVFHRDIKPENILLDQDYNAQLCDFGWATTDIHMKRRTFCGTYQYMSPEMIAKEEYNYKIDIWALGILLYELTHQDAPFVGNNVEEIQAAIARGTYELKPTLSKDLKDLITLILDFDPDKRPTTAEIMKHPWMTQPQDEPMKHRARDQSKDKLVLGEIRGEDRSRAREELQRMRKEEYQRRNHRMDSRDDKFSSSKDGGLRMINNRKNSMADYEHFQDYKPNRPGSKKLRALDNDKLVCVMRNSNSNGYEESMEKENAYQLKPRKITSMLPSPKNTRIEAYRPIKLGDDRIQEYLGGRKGSKRKLH